MKKYEPKDHLLDRLRLMTMPMASVEGQAYYLDLDQQCFRPADRIWVQVPFEAVVGRQMLAELNEDVTLRDQSMEENEMEGMDYDAV